MTAKLITLVGLSCILSLATAMMVLQRQFSHGLVLVALGAFTGWSAVACRGKLPAWLREYWGIAEDSDPRNLPLGIWLPILAVVIGVAGVLIFYAFRF